MTLIWLPVGTHVSHFGQIYLAHVCDECPLAACWRELSAHSVSTPKPSDEADDILPKFGGRAVFAADVTFLALGDVEELWDEVAIAMYPSRADMVRMSLSEEWREAAVHRSAGLKGQLNIETVLPAAQVIEFIKSYPGGEKVAFRDLVRKGCKVES